MMRLREVREKRKISQVSLAQSVGVAQGFISDIENGKCFPSLETLIKIAKALECSLDDLVDIEAAS